MESIPQVLQRQLPLIPSRGTGSATSSNELLISHSKKPPKPKCSQNPKHSQPFSLPPPFLFPAKCATQKNLLNSETSFTIHPIMYRRLDEERRLISLHLIVLAKAWLGSHGHTGTRVEKTGPEHAVCILVDGSGRVSFDRGCDGGEYGGDLGRNVCGVCER